MADEVDEVFWIVMSFIGFVGISLSAIIVTPGLWKAIPAGILMFGIAYGVKNL